nr:site-2 protease family protein [Treponema sp.]
MHILFGIVLLGLIVFFHELGHFAASRICGVKVESFSIGMGPVLLHKEKWGTDWRISLFPFGGYCAMKGEKDIDDENSDLLAAPADSFFGVKAIFRAIIGAAGPAANFIFAILAFSSIFMVGYSYYSSEPVVQIASEIYPETHSAAYDGGIRTGDRILKINGESVSAFTDIQEIVSQRPDEDLTIEVQRESERLSFTVHSDFSEETKKDGSVERKGKIGVMSMKEMKSGIAFHRAILKGAEQAATTTRLYAEGIVSIFKKGGAEFSESVSGPARITTMLGGSTKHGFAATMDFMASISIALFFMNLLPVPVLDGWLVLVSVIEAVFRIRIPRKARTIAQTVGICLIVLLFLFAMASDIKYFVGLFHAKN